MRRFFAVALAALPVLASPPLRAEPLSMTHSGFLLDQTDGPVTRQAMPMRFRLYNVLIPGDTTEQLLWESDTCEVQVASGYYATQIGGTCSGPQPLDAALLPVGAPRFLEVTADGVTLSPRLFIGVVPTAARAGDADRLGGLPPEAWAAQGHDHVAKDVSDFAEAVLSTMGDRQAANPLHHDRYTDAEAVDAVANAGLEWTPKPHTHAADADLTGVLGVAHGGTGLSEGPSGPGQYLRSTAGGWSIGGIAAEDVPGLLGKLDAAGGTMSGTLTLNPASGPALVTANGNMGLGTANPDQRLQVVGGLRVGSGDTYQDVVVESESGFTNGAVKIRPRTVPGSGVANQYLHVAAEGNTTTGPGTRHHLVVDGRVGIGTTSPAAALHVEGDILARNGPARSRRLVSTVASPVQDTWYDTDLSLKVHEGFSALVNVLYEDNTRDNNNGAAVFHVGGWGRGGESVTRIAGSTRVELRFSDGTLQMRRTVGGTGSRLSAVVDVLTH